MFSHVFYLRLSQLDRDRFDFDDDDSNHQPWYSIASTLQTIYFAAFMGDFDIAAFPSG